MTTLTSSVKQGLGFLCLTAALTGCASTSTRSESAHGNITITSEPAGATAYADGTELGVTPLRIVPGDHFRSGFSGLSYRFVGKLSVQKAGCETWTIPVNDYVLSKNVHAPLKCDPNYRAPAADKAAPHAISDDAPVERLERIETLRKKGLISDEEYKQLRARVLDKL